MDFLNKSIAQVSELFRSMTPGARVTAGLLLAIVVVSVGYLFRQGTAGPDAYLFGGEALSDGQLVDIEAAIAQAQLSGAVREGNRIRVPAGQQAKYLAAVADADALPQNFDTILESAIAKGGLWESAAAQRERLKIAKQKTLSEIIRTMSWVDDAVVIYDEQESRELGRVAPTRHKTASVNVQPAVGETLDSRRAKVLQKLVASAVNMKPEDVNVTNLGDGGTYRAGGEILPDDFESAYYQTKVAFELQKREVILAHLRHIPGVQVGVNAELNDMTEDVTTSVKPDEKGTVQSEVEMIESSTQANGATSGQPGPSNTVQGPDRRVTAAAPENKNETKSQSNETKQFVGATKSHTAKTPFTPKEVWATVTIPRSYIKDVWKSRNPDTTTTPKPEDLKPVEDDVVASIQNIVEPLLRLQATKIQDNYKYSSVEVLDTLPAPAIEPPSMVSNAMAWAGRSWNTLAMLGIAVFSLMVLRGVVKSSPPTDATSAAASPGLTLHADDSATGAAGNADEPADDRPRLRLKKGKSLKDDLVEIVREDPDAAADILRSWIGKAG
jgi:flagellar M-ring protein FliF